MIGVVRPLRHAEADGDRDHFCSAGLPDPERLRVQPAGFLGHRLRADGSGSGRPRKAGGGLLQLPALRKAAAVVPPAARVRDAGRDAISSASCCRRSAAGELLSVCNRGQEEQSCQVATHDHSSLACAVAARRRRRWHRRRAARSGRQGHRSDVGRDDRQSRLERHRVHGHQDARRWSARRSWATTSTRTW